MQLLLLATIFVTMKWGLTEQHDYLNCEPTSTTFKESGLIAKYNLTTAAFGFTYRVVYRSGQIFSSSEMGNIDRGAGNKFPHAVLHLLEIKQAGILKDYRTHSYTTIYHFHHGDTATCHQFNPQTGKYTRTQIGFHTRQYFCVAMAGNYFTLDFEKHRHETFAFIGITMIKGNAINGKLVLFTKEEMISKFPEYKEIIQKQQIGQ